MSSRVPIPPVTSPGATFSINTFLLPRRPTFPAFLREINDEAAIAAGPITRPEAPEAARPRPPGPRIGDVSPVTPRVEHQVARHVYIDVDRRRPLSLIDIVT
jgi:hypothetical protein